MSEQTNQEAVTTTNTAEKKPGLIGRLVEKLDKTMKDKAEKQSQQSSCCGGGDNKGDKCC